MLNSLFTIIYKAFKFLEECFTYPVNGLSAQWVEEMHQRINKATTEAELSKLDFEILGVHTRTEDEIVLYKLRQAIDSRLEYINSYDMLKNKKFILN